MSAASRLSPAGRPDRPRQPLPLRFDGRAITAIAGDTLASALLANGVRLVGRSFKYHRPRGILTAGSEEPNALVELRSGAAARTQYPRHHGRAVRRPRRRQPEPLASLRFDLVALNSLVVAAVRRRLLLQDLHVAGGVLGALYEPLIRRAAGLGRASGRARSGQLRARPCRSATCW